MKIRLPLAAILFFFASFGYAQSEKIIVLPVEAIADSAKLNRAEFTKRYPGIDVTGFGLTDEGWYIRYSHELLSYLYGPFDDLDHARREKKLLSEIRGVLVLKNPKLSSSEVEIIRFDFGATPNGEQSQEEHNPYIRPEFQDQEEPEQQSD